MTDDLRTGLADELRDVLIDQCVCFNDPLPAMLAESAIAHFAARLESDAMVERGAKALCQVAIERTDEAWTRYRRLDSWKMFVTESRAVIAAMKGTGA